MAGLVHPPGAKRGSSCALLRFTAMASAGNEAPRAPELRSVMPDSGDLEARRAKAEVAAALFGASASEPVMVGRYEIRSRIGAGAR